MQNEAVQSSMPVVGQSPLSLEKGLLDIDPQGRLGIWSVRGTEAKHFIS
jgi:hypothetical protein